MTEITSQMAVAQVLRRLLRERGLTAKEMSLSLGQNRDYVAGRLRGEAHITLDFLDRICNALGVPLTELIAEAFPFASGATPRKDQEKTARELLAGLTIEGSLAPLPKRLEALIVKTGPIARSPKLYQDPEDFPSSLIREAEPLIQDSVTRAIHYYIFWLEEFANKAPGTVERDVHFPATLASLANLLATRQTGMLAQSRRLLLHALDFTIDVASKVLDAYLMERSAGLFWQLGQKNDALRLLEQPLLLHHPIKESYYRILGNFYFFGFGRLEAALAAYSQAQMYAQSPYEKYSAIQYRALVLAEMTNSRSIALGELGEAKKLELTPKLEWHLRFTEARIGRLTNDYQGTATLLLELIRDPAVPEADIEMMAFFFIELMLCDPPAARMAPLYNQIVKTHDALDADRPHHKAMQKSLREGLSRFALAAPANRLRPNIEPNS